jgi:predicted DsbA family dithiol-disulfide isomerase
LNAPLRVRVHYDFASSLCYVAHRALARLAGPIEALGIELAWTPLELSRLVAPHRPGAPLDEMRRANAARVAAELGVEVRVPRIWPDVNALGAVALLADAEGHGTRWRERAFSAVFEEGRVSLDAAAALGRAREVSLALEPEALAAAFDELERRTEAAREEQVSGVPTFMLGSWPFGGIQTDETMLRVFERFAAKARATDSPGGA